MTGPGVEDLLRELAPRVLGLLTRRYGDFAAAEDAVQEALLAAYTHWEVVPDDPKAWLVRTASRKLIDDKRSEQARRARERTVAASPAPGEVPDTDDTLLVLSLCCHPALTPASAIALTLRAVGGLTTAQIAAAFLVPEATMAQRISRAKQKITPPFEPGPPGSVRHVLYLMFNEGYSARRAELAAEAIRLTRLLPRDDPEVAGLLALMLLQDARRPARTAADGSSVRLPDQDRSRWDRAMIEEGLALLDPAHAGEYQLQAMIAAEHSRALTAAATDWARIAGLYALLDRLTGNPVVTLNRAVAVAMAYGPRAGEEVLDRAADLPQADAVRGHLAELSGQPERAAGLYDRAAQRATSAAEQQQLARRAAQLRRAPR